MLIWYVLLSLIILLLIYMNVEARFIKVEHIRFTKNKKNLKIVQISDIHINHLMVTAKNISKVLQKEKPDFIIMTGDYISKPIHIPAFLKLIREIKGNFKIYACLGNHEYRAFRNDKEGMKNFIDKMKDLGVMILQDSSFGFDKNSHKYSITGFNDCRCNNLNIDTAINSIIPEASTNIALSHNPDIIFEIPQNKIDYLFSGHFHGGQIWAPFDIEFKLLRHEKLCKIKVTRGLHKINGIKLYISRGLGNVCFPFRFLSRPEITVFYIP
jgi:uncharacterized protein